MNWLGYLRIYVSVIFVTLASRGNNLKYWAVVYIWGPNNLNLITRKNFYLLLIRSPDGNHSPILQINTNTATNGKS